MQTPSVDIATQTRALYIKIEKPLSVQGAYHVVRQFVQLGKPSISLSTSIANTAFPILFKATQSMSETPLKKEYTDCLRRFGTIVLKMRLTSLGNRKEFYQQLKQLFPNNSVVQKRLTGQKINKHITVYDPENAFVLIRNNIHRDRWYE